MNDSVSPAVRHLRSAATIRERCTKVFARVEAGESPHFRYDPGRLDAVGEFVLAVTREGYPDLQVPYHSRWRHFDVGGVDRYANLRQKLPADAAERGRSAFELVILSVLLDAGAGMSWKYVEDGKAYSKSEGLALASLAMFAAGKFADDPGQPYRADAKRLGKLTDVELAEGFQVTADNPLVGLEGRLALLQRLGQAVAGTPVWFDGADGPRLGHLFDRLREQADASTGLAAPAILTVILDALGGIWPGRHELDGANLGDVWPHPAVDDASPGGGFVPFHKLSQWLSYSLVEPLEEAGIPVHSLDDLTGLPEYRNGGLLLDMELLVPREPDALSRARRPDEEWIVEWRACTVILLDRIAAGIRERLGLTAEELPLARVLQGGTWTAGRRLAREKRADGGPPFPLVSDGTVF